MKRKEKHSIGGLRILSLKLGDAGNEKSSGKKAMITGTEEKAIQKFHIVREFFQTDGGAEMIESMTAIMEGFLFSGDLQYVTPEMRVHIVNQLRVIALLARLQQTASA